MGFDLVAALSEDAVKAGGFLTGTPVDIIEQLKAVEKCYPGVDRVVCATPLGAPLDVQLEDLDRFAKEVIPPSARPRSPRRRSSTERAARPRMAAASIAALLPRSL